MTQVGDSLFMTIVPFLTNGSSMWNHSCSFFLKLLDFQIFRPFIKKRTVLLKSEMFEVPPKAEQLDIKIINKSGTWQLPVLYHISQGLRKNTYVFWFLSEGLIHKASLRSTPKGVLDFNI